LNLLRSLTGTAAIAVALAGLGAAARQPSASGYTLLTREGRQAVAMRVVNDHEMFALDDLARIFDLTVREDAAAGGLIVSRGAQTIVLTPGQGLASVSGRLVSLPAAPVRDGRVWLVPVEFVSRALAPVYGARLELRKPSRLIIAGDLRVPQIAGRIEPLGDGARLTFDIAPATRHTVAQDGQRLIVQFEADALDALLPAPPTRDLIQAVRPGETPTSLIIDLGPRFASFRAADVPGDRGTGRLAIDVLAPTSTTPPAPPPITATEPPPLIDLAPPGGLRTIVIDPGHGGDELGARGPGGTLEKHVTLQVAQRLKSAIEARLGVRVILTRDGDRTVSLDERAALANNNKADLFLSLHANASVRVGPSGAEVFYLSLEEYGDDAARVARGQGEALPVFGGGSREIEIILWEMAQARHIQESAALAGFVEAALRERVAMSPRAIQQAPFRVLVGANMPAVLVEMGFLTNADQERQLASEAFQSTLVQALVDSVIRFRDSRAAARDGHQPEER
jgi:N-acetylmuramoyl-L-alanine amidase